MSLNCRIRIRGGFRSPNKSPCTETECPTNLAKSCTANPPGSSCARISRFSGPIKTYCGPGCSSTHPVNVLSSDLPRRVDSLPLSGDVHDPESALIVRTRMTAGSPAEDSRPFTLTFLPRYFAKDWTANPSGSNFAMSFSSSRPRSTYCGPGC